jgi:hypothetical protein
MFTVIARSKKFLYIKKNKHLISVMLNHSEEQIGNDFFSLPFFNNEDEVRKAYPELL